jgi:glutamate 5-kinase
MASTIVVKVGTSTLTNGAKKLSKKTMLELARQLSELAEQGNKIILVTSGAIAAGRELLKLPNTERSLPAKQMFAAVGQVELMREWSELFRIFDLSVGQVLLTRHDFAYRKSYLNARDTLFCLLQHKILPIVNENDTVATKEIRVGDNDNLAALVANLVAADLLILLTDQEGLYTADPRENPSAKLIPVVETIDDSIFALAGGSTSELKLGTGGMFTKIEAAQLATQSGTSTIIASFSHPNVLLDLIKGKKVGTFFKAHVNSQESRKRWLLSEKRQGSVVVDEGAEDKIIHHGASLLSLGIKEIKSTFDRGAIIQIVSPKGTSIAVGITNYGSEEIGKLLGFHSNQIEEILGYSYGPEIIHRSNMARLV